MLFFTIYLAEFEVRALYEQGLNVITFLMNMNRSMLG